MRRRPGAAGPGRIAIRLVVVGYLLGLVAWPVALVAVNAFADGPDGVLEVLADPVVAHALWLTASVAVVTVAVNTAFGVGVSLLLVRQRFPGRRLLGVLVDIPLSVSPIVVGLALVLVYGQRDGWLGGVLESLGLQVIFAPAGLVLATAFVTLPLMVREVVPVLQEAGTDQEEVAHTLGASGWQTFRRVTLPAIRWGVSYGAVLSLARSLGEFGAVKVVSGNVAGQTRTATLVVEERYLNFDQTGAYATAFLLALVAVACVVAVSAARSREGHG